MPNRSLSGDRDERLPESGWRQRRDRDRAGLVVNVDDGADEIARSRMRDRELIAFHDHVEWERGRRAVRAIEEMVERAMGHFDAARVGGLVASELGRFALAVGRAAFGRFARRRAHDVAMAFRHVETAPGQRRSVGREIAFGKVLREAHARRRHGHRRVERSSRIVEMKIENGLATRRIPIRGSRWWPGHERCVARRTHVDEAPFVDVENRMVRRLIGLQNRVLGAAGARLRQPARATRWCGGRSAARRRREDRGDSQVSARAIRDDAHGALSSEERWARKWRHRRR